MKTGIEHIREKGQHTATILSAQFTQPSHSPASCSSAALSRRCRRWRRARESDGASGAYSLVFVGHLLPQLAHEATDLGNGVVYWSEERPETYWDFDSWFRHACRWRISCKRSWCASHGWRRSPYVWRPSSSPTRWLGGQCAYGHGGVAQSSVEDDVLGVLSGGGAAEEVEDGLGDLLLVSVDGDAEEDADIAQEKVGEGLALQLLDVGGVLLRALPMRGRGGTYHLEGETAELTDVVLSSLLVTLGNGAPRTAGIRECWRGACGRPSGTRGRRWWTPSRRKLAIEKRQFAIL